MYANIKWQTNRIYSGNAGYQLRAGQRESVEAAGAETIVRVFRNQNASDIRSSIEQYKRDIKKSQIIMFPVDFSR